MSTSICAPSRIKLTPNDKEQYLSSQRDKEDECIVSEEVEEEEEKTTVLTSASINTLAEEAEGEMHQAIALEMVCLVAGASRIFCLLDKERLPPSTAAIVTRSVWMFFKSSTNTSKPLSLVHE